MAAMGSACMRAQRVDPYGSNVDGRSGGSHSKVSEALRVKSSIIRSGQEPPLSFDKLLLKFPAIAATLEKINAIFDQVDVNGDGKLDFEEFKKGMAQLDVVLEDEEVLELFTASDMQVDHELSRREFLVCLAMGFMIDALPALRQSSGMTVVQSEPDTPSEAANAATKTASERRPFTQMKDRSISDTMMLITRTYLMFDAEGKGHIGKKELMGVLEEQARGRGAKGHNPLASKDRWAEMDWDHNNCITYQEFVFSFYTWVKPEGIEE